MSLGRAIRERLHHLLLDRRLERIDTVARDLEELRRERAEISRQIPTWDRVYVFDDTPDEARVRTIDLALEPRVTVLRQLREEVATDLEKVGDEYPPFGIGVAIERAFRLAAGELRPGPTWAADCATLAELLSGIADQVARNWVPDFSPGELLGELADVERCRRIAAKVPLADHPRLGIAPTSQEALRKSVAQRLLAGEFFTAQAEQGQAQDAHDLAARAAAEASTRIPLLERLNVFSEGPAQIALSERQEELLKTEEALRRAFERSQALLHEALGAYPPLLVHQRALEASGVAALLRVERVPTLSPDGRRREEEIVVPRALVVAALRRLIRAFADAFPGVPLPLSVAQERSAIGARRRSPREHLERAVFTALEEGWALDLRRRALEHAALLGMTARELATQQAPGGWLGRLGTTGGREALSQRRAWHEVAATDCWRHVLLHTRRQCETLAPLAARDLVLQASRALTEVRTDVGEFTSPQPCALHGLPAVRSALSAVERSLGEHYDLRGTPLDLLQEIATSSPTQSEEIPRAPFEPLTRPQLVARLAGWFPTGLADRLAALDPVAPEEWLAAVEGEPSADADSTRALALRALASELDLALQAAYPPARLYFELARVARRVDGISTECAPHRVEINGKTETRYACQVRDQKAAVEAMEALGSLLHETYGELPGAHELLLIWERSAVVESSWLAE